MYQCIIIPRSMSLLIIWFSYLLSLQAAQPPILIDNGVAVLENDLIERHIMKKIPGGHNLFVPDQVTPGTAIIPRGMSWLSWRNFILQEVNKKIENLYSKFKLMLLKRDDASKAALTKTLEKWVQCTQCGCKNNHKHSNFASSSSKNTFLHSGLTSCWPPRGRGSWQATPCAASTASWCRSCSTSGWQVRPCMQPAVLQCPLTPTCSGSLQTETTFICQVWHANGFCPNISRPGRVTLALTFNTSLLSNAMQYFRKKSISLLFSFFLPIKKNILQIHT